MIPQFFKRRILTKTSSDSLLRFFVIIPLAIEKIDSEGAEVAGIARYLRARIARIGYSKALFF